MFTKVVSRQYSAEVKRSNAQSRKAKDLNDQVEAVRDAGGFELVLKKNHTINERILFYVMGKFLCLIR